MNKRKLMKAITIEDNLIVIRGIDLSKMSIRILEDIGGDLETRDVGGDNLQGVINGDNSQREINGNNHQWDIKGSNQQCRIYGDNRQGDIGGNNYQQDIGGNNYQRDIANYNRQSNIGGNNHQWDIGGENSQNNIKGNNNQRNVLGYSRNSKHWVDELGGVCSTDIDCTDGVLMHSVKVRKLKRGVEYVTGKTSGNEDTYLVKSPNLAYHSDESMKDAKEGFKAKRDRLLADIGAWVETLTDKSTITRDRFHKETGACMPGIEAWCEKVGIKKSTKSITFKRFKKLAEQHPTMETKRVITALNELKGGK